MCWNQSLILSASSLHAKRYTCIYLKYVNMQISQSNINFEENIFVLTVLSYRKIPTGREEVFTLRVFSFLWANIHQRLISLFINFLSGIAVTLALIRSPESDFGWLGRPAVQIYISSFVAEFFVSYQDFRKRFKYWKKIILIYDEKMHKLLWWISKWYLNEKGTWHEILTQIGDAKCPVRKRH